MWGIVIELYAIAKSDDHIYHLKIRNPVFGKNRVSGGEWPLWGEWHSPLRDGRKWPWLVSGVEPFAPT